MRKNWKAKNSYGVGAGLSSAQGSVQAPIGAGGG